MFSPAALLRNKRRGTIKVRSQKYIKNQAEPGDKPSHDSLNRDETVLVESSPIMRRRFRFIAQRMRIINIHGINKTFRDK